MIAADEELIKGKMKQLGMLEDPPPPHMLYIGTNPQDQRTSYNHIKVLPH